MSELRARLPVWPLLGVAMALAAVWIMTGGRQTTLGGDEVFYYGDLIEKSGIVVHLGGLEGLFAPHNGHFVLVGRLIYKGLFAIGAEHFWAFRAVEAGGVLICVGLFYALARRRTDRWIAFAMCVSLLFAGWAWETLLWPFDLHTVYALAFGLAAVLALEREDGRGDALACAFLVLGVATLEVGLAFVVGIAISILLRGDRWRRIWIVAVPIVIYGIWWLWAAKFHQSEVHIKNLDLIPSVYVNGLASVVGSITGLNPIGPGTEGITAGPTAAGTVIAAVAVIALIWRLRGVGARPTMWIAVGTLLAYWLTIALGGRQPETTRYIFVGSLLLLLIAAEALARARISSWALGGVFLLVALAIGPNIAKFYEARNQFEAAATPSRAELAMVYLARERVSPAYAPGGDQRVIERGGGALVPMTAGVYLENREEKGSLQMSLAELRAQPEPIREVADATSVGAEAIALRPVRRPSDLSGCATVDGDEVGPQNPGALDLESGDTLIGARGGSVTIGLRRFAGKSNGVVVGSLEAGRWAEISIPADESETPWEAVVDGPLYICPAAG